MKEKIKIKNRTLALFGIGTYILSVLALVENLAGNYAAPVALIVASAIATISFTIMAFARLWKKRKVISALLFISSAVTFVYIIPIIQGINTFILIWVIIVLWRESDDIKLVKENNINL